MAEYLLSEKLKSVVNENCPEPRWLDEGVLGKAEEAGFRVYRSGNEVPPELWIHGKYHQFVPDNQVVVARIGSEESKRIYGIHDYAYEAFNTDSEFGHVIFDAKIMDSSTVTYVPQNRPVMRGQSYQNKEGQVYREAIDTFLIEAVGAKEMICRTDEPIVSLPKPDYLTGQDDPDYDVLMFSTQVFASEVEGLALPLIKQLRFMTADGFQNIDVQQLPIPEWIHVVSLGSIETIYLLSEMFNEGVLGGPIAVAKFLAELEVITSRAKNI